MWEAIERNQRRSSLLVGIMVLVLLVLGYLIGLALFASHGGVIGALVAGALAAALLAAAFWRGEQAVLLAAAAREVRKEDSPRLWNVVEEMTLASGLGAMPRIYVIEDDQPNAFAAGLKPEKAVVAVTSGLLLRLNRDELQGVVAHEIAHIKNQDARFMTLASVLLGSIVLLSQFYLRYMWFGGGRRRTASKGGGAAHPWLVVAAVLAAILSPIAARFLYFACSRRREFLADASAAQFTRYPEGLAAALEKISLRASREDEVNRALAPLYIVNPLESFTASGLFSTHPRTTDRIRILRGMGGRAGYVDYEAAYRRAFGAASRCIGMRTLSAPESRSVAAREPSVEPDTPAGAIERMQEVTGLLDRMVELLIFSCACGVKIKVPPEFDGAAVSCPRCGRANELPRATAAGESAAAVAAAGSGNDPGGDGAPPAAGPARFTRSDAGWQTFRCPCDRVIQLAPSFRGSAVACPSCGRWIEVLTVSQAEPEATLRGP